MNGLQTADVVEQFFGVYLLYCINPRYNGRTYIGYTCDPIKRIKQHNTGVRAGGARRTHSKGPWEMVLIVHGFHNSVSALRFEWAWQHPRSSLRKFARKSPKETRFHHAIRILSKMLSSTPWCKLPLTIRWINEERVCEFSPDYYPPVHMPIVYGPVIAKKLAQGTRQDNLKNSDTVKCFLCHREVDEKHKVQCIKPSCACVYHLICLARHFIGNNESLLPVEGNCPSCNSIVLWGDLIRKKRGCVVDVENSELSFLCDDQVSQTSSNDTNSLL